MNNWTGLIPRTGFLRKVTFNIVGHASGVSFMETHCIARIVWLCVSCHIPCGVPHLTGVIGMVVLNAAARHVSCKVLLPFQQPTLQQIIQHQCYFSCTYSDFVWLKCRWLKWLLDHPMNIEQFLCSTFRMGCAYLTRRKPDKGSWSEAD